MPDSSQNNFSQMLKVEISDKKMKAFLVAKDDDAENLQAITLPDVLNIIEKAGVKFGINEERINEIISNKKWQGKTLIAEGSYAAPGDDAKLEFYFPTEKSLKPQILENGFIDYKEVNIVNSVEKDSTLVKKIAAALGLKGTDVFGNEIPASYGKDITLITGPGTYRDPNDSSIIKSLIEGVVFYNSRNHSIEVQRLYKVQHSVDYSTGNLHVKSSVEIGGDVEAGFSVTTPYNVQVKGVVELASISCDGTLKVKDGIIGDGKQIIKVGGDIHTGYINNYYIKCGGSVYVSNEIRNAVIECDEEVVVVKGTGVILGGKITATNRVCAPFIGNYYNVPTEIEVGIISKYKEKFLHIESERIRLQKEMDDLTQKISFIARGSPESVKDSRLHTYKAQWNECSEKLEKINNESKEFEETYFNASDPVVQVTKTVFPGVLIKIKHATFEVQQELSHVVFRLSEDEIVFSNAK